MNLGVKMQSSKSDEPSGAFDWASHQATGVRISASAKPGAPLSRLHVQKQGSSGSKEGDRRSAYKPPESCKLRRSVMPNDRFAMVERGGGLFGKFRLEPVEEIDIYW